MLGGMGLIRAAMRRAARQLGWRVRTVGYARERLVLVLVQDVREAPAEVSDALEKDFRRIGREDGGAHVGRRGRGDVGQAGARPCGAADSSVPASRPVGGHSVSRCVVLRGHLIYVVGVLGCLCDWCRWRSLDEV